MTNKLLTKTRYMIGLQCPKCLWTAVNRPEMIPEPDEATRHMFDEGTKVGILAQSLFPGGMDCNDDDFGASLEKAKDALNKGRPLLEAGFMSNRCYSRADILMPDGDGWDIVEVKMGTKVKPENVEDVAFQKFCYVAAGLKVRRCFLMHINNGYIRKGEIDAKSLFMKEDITEDVGAIKDIPERARKMIGIIDSPESPEMNIGGHCSAPYECGLMDECWKFLPEHNIFHLYRGGAKAFDLYGENVLELKDIPEGFMLTTNQQIQRQCARTGKAHIDRKKLKEWIDKLEYPLHYLDFETFSTAIPLYDGTKPYQQIPFQFSLHIQEKPGGELKHTSFLAEGKDDPRKKFIEALVNSLGDKGSIVVYDQSFEISRIRELAGMFPEHRKWLEKTIRRIIDLLTPFRNFYYYNPSQKGSASLKRVLPAVTGKSYGMEISDGRDASLAFLNLMFTDISDEDKAKIRQNLEKYCEFDTKGMVWIVEELRKLI